MADKKEITYNVTVKIGTSKIGEERVPAAAITGLEGIVGDDIQVIGIRNTNGDVRKYVLAEVVAPKQENNSAQKEQVKYAVAPLLFKGLGHVLHISYNSNLKNGDTPIEVFNFIIDDIFKQMAAAGTDKSFKPYLVKNLVETCLDVFHEQAGTAEEFYSSSTSSVLLKSMYEKILEAKMGNLGGVDINALAGSYNILNSEYSEKGKLACFEDAETLGRLKKEIAHAGATGRIDLLLT